MQTLVGAMTHDPAWGDDPNLVEGHEQKLVDMMLIQ